MCALIIDKTEKTPEVVVDYNENRISIKGVCTPENPTLFFEPVYREIVEYKREKSELLFDIHLQYFNTGASKCIVSLLMEAAKYENEFQKTKVNWIYDKGDDELMEVGQEFSAITRLEFNYIETNDE